MPLERDNDEERRERINSFVQRSAEQLRANRLRGRRPGNGGDRGDHQSWHNLAWLPLGYRVARGTPAESIECDRGCGWRQTLETLMALESVICNFQSRQMPLGSWRTWIS